MHCARWQYYFRLTVYGIGLTLFSSAQPLPSCRNFFTSLFSCVKHSKVHAYTADASFQILDQYEAWGDESEEENSYSGVLMTCIDEEALFSPLELAQEAPIEKYRFILLEGIKEGENKTVLHSLIKETEDAFYQSVSKAETLQELFATQLEQFLHEGSFDHKGYSLLTTYLHQRKNMKSACRLYDYMQGQIPALSEEVCSKIEHFLETCDTLSEKALEAYNLVFELTEEENNARLAFDFVLLSSGLPSLFYPIGFFIYDLTHALYHQRNNEYHILQHRLDRLCKEVRFPDDLAQYLTIEKIIFSMPQHALNATSRLIGAAQTSSYLHHQLHLAYLTSLWRRIQYYYYPSLCKKPLFIFPPLPHVLEP